MIHPNGRVTLADTAALVSPYRTLSLVDLDQFVFPAIDWIVDGLIPAGALVLFVGRPKAGKSLLAIDLLASVALGETFLNRATTQGPAMYLPAEDALRLVRDRLWNRLNRERAAPLLVVPADGSIDQSVRLDDPASFGRLARTVEAHRPALLVLDPLRELHQRKENDADEMAALLRPLRQLAHETDTAIVLIHHRNKSIGDASLASRGSSAIPGSVDVVVTLDLSGDDADGELTPDQTVTLRVEGRYGPRQRLGARLGTGLRWQPADHRHGDDLSVAHRIQRHLEVSDERLTADELAREIAAAKKSVQNDLSEMVKAGRVTRHGAGTKSDPYVYGMHAGGGRGTHLSASGQANGMIPPSVHDYTPREGGIIAKASQTFCRVCHGLLPLPVDRERGAHLECSEGGR